MKKITSALIAATFLFLGAAWGQEAKISFDVSPSGNRVAGEFSVNWAAGEFYTQVSFSLAQAGIRLPTGRFTGEEILRDASPRLMRENLLSIKFDSSTTIKDLVDRGELGLWDLDAICQEAEKTAPSLSPDLTRMGASYKLFVEKISARFISHRRASEPVRPLVPVPAADYTGIIIIANGELPVHGRSGRAFAEPCLFPKIWDTEMNLIYERNMFEPGRIKEAPMARYAVRDSVFRPTPSGLDGELATLAGPNPLRVIASALFGIYPTDLVIDRDDALKIISSDNNRRLLREGKVILVLNENALR